MRVGGPRLPLPEAGLAGKTRHVRTIVVRSAAVGSWAEGGSPQGLTLRSPASSTTTSLAQRQPTAGGGGLRSRLEGHSQTWSCESRDLGLSSVAGCVCGDPSRTIIESSWVNRPQSQPQTGRELQRATQLIRTGNSSLAHDLRIPNIHSSSLHRNVEPNSLQITKTKAFIPVLL